MAIIIKGLFELSGSLTDDRPQRLGLATIIVDAESSFFGRLIQRYYDGLHGLGYTIIAASMDKNHAVINKCDIHKSLWWHGRTSFKVHHRGSSALPGNMYVACHMCAEIRQDEVHAQIEQDISHWVAWARASGGLAGVCKTLDCEVRVVQQVLEDVLHMLWHLFGGFVGFGCTQKAGRRQLG